MQGEYGRKVRERENQEIQITRKKFQVKRKERAYGQAKMKDHIFAGL